MEELKITDVPDNCMRESGNDNPGPIQILEVGTDVGLVEGPHEESDEYRYCETMTKIEKRGFRDLYIEEMSADP
jgi:hypothetical protein